MNLGKSKSNRRPKSSRARKRRQQQQLANRLGFESLEDRRLLATFSVTNLDDGGGGSLRAAIGLANNLSGADEIVFTGAATSGVIDLTSGELGITDTLTINGPGENSLTIDAHQDSRALNFTGLGDLTIKSLTVTGGRTTGNNSNNTFDTTHSGGGIRFAGGSSGRLTLDSVTVNGNLTEGDFAKGGGVFSSGFTTLTDSTVSGNWTADSRGGGIYSYRNITLSESTVSGNRTEGRGGFGGGIAANMLVTLTNSTVSGNRTTDNLARGGGIFSFDNVVLNNSTVSGNSTAGNDADGGGIAASDVTLNNSTVSGNSATGVDGSGGGIFANGDITLNFSTITDNSAAFRGGGVDHGNGPGAVIVSGSIVADNTNTTSNTRSDIGLGAQATLSASYSLLGTNVLPFAGTNILSDNPLLGPLANNIGPTQTHALLPGSPAIDVGNPTIAFSASEFDQRGAPFVRVFDGGVNGTRIDIGAFELQPLPSSFLIVDSSSNIDDGDFSAGQFTLREAIGLANFNPGADTILFDLAVAGGTMNLAGAELVITEALTIDATSIPITAGKPRIDAAGSSRIFNITASTGDFTFAGLTLLGGRTTGNFEHGGAIFSGTTGELTLDRTSVNGNKTEGVLAFGGGIYAEGDVTLRRSNMSGNTTTGNASSGGGIFAIGNVLLTDFSGISTSNTTGDNADGGAIRANGDVTVNDSQVNVNSTTGANSFGGAIRSRGDVTLNNSGVILNSTAGDAARGGGISADGNVTLAFANVVSNSTLGDDAIGGGVHAAGDVILIADTEVRGNTTAGDDATGGGVHAGGDVTLSNSAVELNSTAGFAAYGGGIFSPVAVTLTGSTVSGNSTAATFARGGGIYSEGAVTLTNSTISGNSTAGLGADGGGISSKGNLMLNSSTVSGNFTTADSADGGGIFSLLGAVGLTNSTVSGNSTAGNSADSGGIYSKGAVTLMHSTVTDNHATHANAFGGGIWNDNDALVINNSIVADNAAGGGLNDIRPGTGTFDINFSLIGDPSGTSLTPTGGVPGANGNIIGGGTVDLQVAIDFAAFGDFELTDQFDLSYTINGGSLQPLFTGVVDDASSQSYTLEDGTTVVRNDPLLINGTTLSNVFQTLTATIPGVLSGASVEIVLVANTNGGGETFIFRNMVVTELASGSLVAQALATSSDFNVTFTQDDPDYSLSEDMFGIRSRTTPGTPGLPSVVVDDSVANPLDTDGIIRSSDTGDFFGVADTNNFTGNDTNIARWTLLGPTTLDPLLGPLADNGGPTETHALLVGSPAIDAGNNALAVDQNSQPLTVDQRGFTRVVDGDNDGTATVDIGAVEQAPLQVASTDRDEGGVLARPDLLSMYTVTFNMDVNVGAEDLVIRNDTLGGTVVDSSILIFNYDETSRTAEWDFGSLILDAAFYSFELSDSITAAGGLALDGDTDGNAGGAYLQPIYVALPGDANLDGQVDVLSDAAILVDNLGMASVAAWAQGDFNGDGAVDVLNDAAALVNRLGQSVVPPSAALASVTALASVATTGASEPAGFVTEQEEDRQRLSWLSPAQQLSLAGSQALDTAFASDSLIEEGVF